MSPYTSVADHEIGNLSNRKLLELLQENTQSIKQIDDIARRVREELSRRQPGTEPLVWRAPH